MIDEEGLIVTIGYLIMEADTVTVTDIEGRELPARSWATTMKAASAWCAPSVRRRSSRCRSANSDV